MERKRGSKKTVVKAEVLCGMRYSVAARGTMESVIEYEAEAYHPATSYIYSQEPLVDSSYRCHHQILLHFHPENDPLNVSSVDAYIL